MNFPRYMFAIGGAGKNIIYTLFEKEWILKEILKPQFAATTVDVTIIDTAIFEENEDLEKIAAIKEDIKRIEEEYRVSLEPNRNIGRINFNYMLLTKEMVLRSPYDLIGIGQNVKQATGASIWWINDPELGEDWHKRIINRENFKELNFSKGVYRKRAIGKAIYYKAVAAGLFEVDLLQSAQIDIIVGIGGGTGSGMAFDLATRLKNIQPTANITLFGILSTLDESPDEKANNFAMLSELEHGYLNKNSPFKDVILIPMEVTKYPGREQASDEHERLLREFDETVPYILTAYHNNPAQRLFEGIPDYAPFIIGTSQLVRYNVESIRRLKERFIDAISNKEKSLEDENHIYNSIDRFISEFYNGEPGTLSDEDKSFLKDERFSKFIAVLDHEFFKELDYESVKHLKKAVDAGILGSRSDDIEKQIPSIKSEMDTVTVGDKGFRDNVDQKLYGILKKDIETIEILKNMLNSINGVEDELSKDTLKVLVKVDEYSLGRKLNQIRDVLDKLSGDKRYNEGHIKSLEKNISDFEERIRKDIQKNGQEWEQTEGSNIKLLDNIDDAVVRLNNEFTNLNDELEEFVTRIKSINKNIDAEPTKSIENILDKIYIELERIGLYYDDKNLIIRNLSNIKEWKKSYLESKKRIPIFDKLVGMAIKTGRIKRQKEAANKLRLKTTEINTDKIFEIRDNVPLNIYQYNISLKIKERKDDIIGSMIKRTEDKFKGAIPSTFVNLKEILQDHLKRKGINIGEIVRSDIGYDEYINKVNVQLHDANKKMNQILDDIKKFESIEKLLKNNIPIVRRHAEFLRNYHNHITNIDKDVQAMHRADRETIRYIMEMQPTNIYRATVAGANINNILEDEKEMSSLKQNLQDGIERTMDIRYNVLVRRVIETEDNTRRWEKTKVMNSFVTIANINPEDIDSRTAITEAFSVLRENYSQWKCPYGEAWGVGLVLFIDGVPFDNIRNITDARAGYYRYYKEIEKVGRAFFHHSYLLEKGIFVKRKQIYNFEDEGDKQFLLNDNAESTYSQNYEDINIRDSLK